MHPARAKIALTVKIVCFSIFGEVQRDMPWPGLSISKLRYLTKPMVSYRFLRLTFLPLALLVCLSAASAQSTTQDTPPTPPTVSPSGTVLPDAPPEHASNDDHYAISKWHGVLDPGDKVPPLSDRDKMEFWLHEEISPVGAIPALISSGYSHMVGSDPRYGGDAPAFGERFGAAMLREASMRFFSDSLLPTLTHEDPRYFRMAYGSDKDRALYAAERVFVDRRDVGVRGINFSDTLGRLAASALTRAYYPYRSANTEVVFKTYGYSLAGAVGDNLLLEFWPDIRDRVFHRHRSQP
jgi:hypothetical protein